jgi:nucleoside-diphosphate-sugar epimerase
MLYIDDLCSAVERAIVSEGMEGRVLEVHDGAENGYSWQQVADAAGRYFGRNVRSISIPLAVLWPIALANQGIGKLVGSAPMLTPGKLREMYHADWACRDNPLSQATNWKPTVTILEGFKRSCVWYEREGWF